MGRFGDKHNSAEEPAVRNARGGAGLRVPLGVLGVVAAVLLVAGFTLGRVVFSSIRGAEAPVTTSKAQVLAEPSVSAAASTGTVLAVSGQGMIEVPAVGGMRADEALVVLETAGFKVVVVDMGESVSKPSRRLVALQRPAPTTLLTAGSTVTLLAPPLSTTTTETPSATLPSSRKHQAVVCIDPGHQAHSEVKLEPIGPGSKLEKPRATGGATGVATGIPEHEIALQISMNLKKRLEDRGIKVVMTRTTNDVHLSNSQRARIANRAHADLFVRVHCGASTEASESGVTTYYPSRNHWTSRMVAPSRAAAQSVERALARTTGMMSRGALQQANVAGFNWSKVPSVVVEVGFLSNPMEDRLISSPNHQDKIADGIAQGVQTYLDARRP